MGPEEESITDVEDRILRIEERRQAALHAARERVMQQFEPELREARNDLAEARERKAIQDVFTLLMGRLN